MDVPSITAAYQGLKAAKEIISAAFDAKVDAEAKPKILDALQKLGHAQDTLFSLREELFNLQETNNALRGKLTEFESWQGKVDQYELTKTQGEAIVHKFKGSPEHYACPSCFNLKQIHILQNNRTMNGTYKCTGCESEYPVDQQRKHAPLPAPKSSAWT